MAFLGQSSSLFVRKPSGSFCTRIPQIFSQFDQVTYLSSPRSTMKECEFPSHTHISPLLLTDFSTIGRICQMRLQLRSVELYLG